MSRTASAGMATMLALPTHTRCNMLLLDLIDGTSIGITDHDQDLNFDIGDGIISYSSGTGVFTSDVVLTTTLDADNYEVTGPIGETVTLEAVLGGRFNRARARLFQVNWKTLGSGALRIMAGNVTQARVEGGRFTMEIRSDCDLFNQTVGRLITNTCDADYGDARCGDTPTTTVGTVTAVTDALRFTVSYPDGPYANNFFNKGTVIALTGDLAGTAPVDIEDWTVGGAITLFSPLVEVPIIGDTFTVRNGCGKTRADCMAHDNILNFRGYPEIPGSDQILRQPIPGQGNDE